MVKKAVKAEVKSFVKGLITEASPLNFPEDASADEVNFELLRDGTRQRRLGMDYEPGFQLNSLGGFALPSDLSSAKTSTYVWETVGGISGKYFLALQVNDVIHFYDLKYEFLSASGYVGGVVIPSSYSGQALSFTSVNGYLIAASGDYFVHAISYQDGVFAITPYSLKVRDFWGVEDATPDNDPYFAETVYSAARTYNLYNQSWGIPRRWQGASDKQLTDPTSYYFSQYERYPSNSETVWISMSVKPDADPYEYMRPSAWSEKISSLPPASKGYFVIDLLKRGASRIEAVEANKTRFTEMTMATLTTPSDYTSGGAKIVTEFAGRVFYAGFSGDVTDGHPNSPSLTNYVLFSQLVKGKGDFSKCYQEGDPTSREGNEIVDTDGGFVRISGASEIIGLESIGSSLIVIATNGIWEISGGSDYGFTATNYKVTELSNFGCVSTGSIIKAGESLLYWGFNSIFTVARDKYGKISVSPITDETIQSLYSEIALDTKIKTFGIYDDVSKTARWIYSDAYAFGEQLEVHELILDTKLGAFYPYLIKNPSTHVIKGMFTIPSSQELLALEAIASGTELVFSNVDAVVVDASRRAPSKSGVKYVVFVNDGVVKQTFSYYLNQEFLDWGTTGNGIDAKAHLLTGAITGNDSSVSKQAPYIVVHMMRTEEGVTSEMTPINQSGCFMRAQWGWSNSIASNKWGQSQQVYRYTRGFTTSSSASLYDTGFEMITTKNKIRGAGKALSIYFETEPNKDCKLVGWNISINGNSIT